MHVTRTFLGSAHRYTWAFQLATRPARGAKMTFATSVQVEDRVPQASSAMFQELVHIVAL